MKNEKKELTARDLALFLGCEIEWMGERGYTLTGINTADEYINPVGLKKDELHYWANIENVRPILRPFSDITDQELQENRKVYLAAEQQYGVSQNAAGIRHWISIGLDLFGWIPAGLAVDATKKEVQP